MRLRARLHFHRSYLHSHSKLSSSHNQPCPLCNSDIDTIFHLLQCSELSVYTDELTNALEMIDLHPCVPYLVGNLTGVAKKHRHQVLQVTQEYLSQVLMLRHKL